MWEIIVSILGEDGSTENITLNLVSQLEFEELEGVSSIINCFVDGISRRQELRLAWLARKQMGITVPADLKAFAGTIKAVKADVSRLPFGDQEPTE